ncbi:xylan 1,4-beta-xylosidase [Fictibacillus enclensis]|uniref:Beta-xylosidase n=1 Tax=Fictibacillus enclensis TaxID=1017270 RepID=A0A0V8J237_9BACL|nr:glycoside hydrolase family 43 protein [Fictibacillus enclensis]KSU81087.1 beta-xylosidase [Fictibacillus enclensis]SCC34926.1 xylan 1,4-beta-xylosidase [Fictibacillus enclensis]
MSEIINPILRGFNPDPSILRVEGDYYIATSTFEWFPGVQIHHSKDLRNWELLPRPLTRKSQLDMLGNPSSGGVWAPCLSYHEGTFYLIYTDVKSHIGPFKDTHNYLVTATDIQGPWSEPIYLNSSGFDPSLFHDDNGKKWLVNMVWDHRKNKNSFGGILLQEYSPQEEKLVGSIRNIFKGTSLGLTEAPHLYKKNGYYYLVTAEGGTRYNHAVTVARSQSLFGPYEVDPKGPVLTSKGKPELALQKAGHASIVETQDNEVYMVHLTGRPLPGSENCNLGRETSIQKAVWTDDHWLRLEDGGNRPHERVEAPSLPEFTIKPVPETDDFDGEGLSIHFNSLREPMSEEWVSVKERPGYLRLRGRESMNSNHRQSLIARRQQAFSFLAETEVECCPQTFQQMAGLIYYYNNRNYYYLCISKDEEAGKCLYIMSNDQGDYDESLDAPISIEGWEKVYLKAEIEYHDLQFYYSPDGEHWKAVGPVLDAGKISDDHAELKKGGTLLDQGFTGAFIGLCSQDLSGRDFYADFDYFSYVERGVRIQSCFRTTEKPWYVNQ